MAHTAEKSNDKEAVEDEVNLKEMIHNVLRELDGSMKENSNSFQESVANYCKEKPLKAVGIAVLAGLFLGKFLRK